MHSAYEVDQSVLQTLRYELLLHNRGRTCYCMHTYFTPAFLVAQSLHLGRQLHTGTTCDTSFLFSSRKGRFIPITKYLVDSLSRLYILLQPWGNRLTNGLFFSLLTFSSVSSFSSWIPDVVPKFISDVPCFPLVGSHADTVTPTLLLDWVHTGKELYYFVNCFDVFAFDRAKEVHVISSC